MAGVEYVFQEIQNKEMKIRQKSLLIKWVAEQNKVANIFDGNGL